MSGAARPPKTRFETRHRLIGRTGGWRPAGRSVYDTPLDGAATLPLDLREPCHSTCARHVRDGWFAVDDERHLVLTDGYPAGGLLCEVDVAAFWRRVGLCLAIHRAELRDLLLEATGDVAVRLGQAVDRVAQRNGVVSAPEAAR